MALVPNLSTFLPSNADTAVPKCECGKFHQNTGYSRVVTYHEVYSCPLGYRPVKELGAPNAQY